MQTPGHNQGKVGQRLKVWDEAAQAWQQGVVTEASGAGSMVAGRVRVAYEQQGPVTAAGDFETEELDLSQERVEWEKDDASSSSGRSGSGSSSAGGSTSSSSSRATPLSVATPTAQAAAASASAAVAPAKTS
jgi:hypothetical protein